MKDSRCSFRSVPSVHVFTGTVQWLCGYLPELLVGAGEWLCGYLPELLVGAGEILVDRVQMGVVAQEHLVGGRMLEHLGDGAQVPPLVSGQLTARRHLDDVKSIRCHDSGIHVTVVQQVAHNLKYTRHTHSHTY